MQGVSRTLWEEVRFDRKNVTSVDWLTYPILDITETPEAIDVVLINRPELPPSGAGEPSIRPVAAAIANAIFDATGVRIRRVPFSPDRVKAACRSRWRRSAPSTPRSSRSPMAHAGGAARTIRRRHGGDPRADPAGRQDLHLVALPTSTLQADLLIRGRCDRDARDLRGEPRRTWAGAAFHRGREEPARSP